MLAARRTGIRRPGWDRATRGRVLGRSTWPDRGGRARLDRAVDTDRGTLLRDDLIAAVRRETARFRQGLPVAGSEGHELMRRAIEGHNDAA